MELKDNMLYISNKFEDLKRKLGNAKNILLSYLYYYANSKKYESIIKKVNFYHYATEAFLIEGHRITSLNLNTDQLISNLDSILKRLDFDKYIKNLEMLTNSKYNTNPMIKIGEIKMARLFIDTLAKYTNEDNLEELFIKTVSTCCYILSTSLKKQVRGDVGDLDNFDLLEKTISQVNLDDNNLEFYRIYRALEYKNKEHNLLNFLRDLKVGNTIEKIIQANRKNRAQSDIIKIFYFYAKTPLKIIIKDIELFYDNASSNIKWIKNTIVKRIRDISTMDFSNKLTERANNLKGNLDSFYESYGYGINSNDFSYKYFTFKQWVQDSLFSSPSFLRFLSSSEEFMQGLIIQSNSIRRNPSCKIYEPCKNMLIVFSDNIVSFVLLNIKNVQNLSRVLTRILIDKMKSMKLYSSTNEPICAYTNSKVNLIRFDFSKEFLLDNITLVDHIRNTLKARLESLSLLEFQYPDNIGIKLKLKYRYMMMYD